MSLDGRHCTKATSRIQSPNLKHPYPGHPSESNVVERTSKTLLDKVWHLQMISMQSPYEKNWYSFFTAKA